MVIYGHSWRCHVSRKSLWHTVSLHSRGRTTLVSPDRRIHQDPDAPPGGDLQEEFPGPEAGLHRPRLRHGLHDLRERLQLHQRRRPGIQERRPPARPGGFIRLLIACLSSALRRRRAFDVGNGAWRLKGNGGIHCMDDTERCIDVPLMTPSAAGGPVLRHGIHRRQLAGRRGGS